MLYSDNITGKRIFDLRNDLKYNYTQEELAERISVIVNKEISRQKIAQWEMGRPISKLDELKALAMIFNCQIGYLLGEEDYDCKTRGNSFIREETGLSEEAIENLKKIKIYKEVLGKAYYVPEVINDLLEDISITGNSIISLIELYSHQSIKHEEITLKNRNSKVIFSTDIIMEGVLVKLQGEVQKYREKVQDKK